MILKLKMIVLDCEIYEFYTVFKPNQTKFNIVAEFKINTSSDLNIKIFHGIVRCADVDIVEQTFDKIKTICESNQGSILHLKDNEKTLQDLALIKIKDFKDVQIPITITNKTEKVIGNFI